MYHMGQVMKLQLSCQMLAKPGNKTAAPSWTAPYDFVTTQLQACEITLKKMW